MQTIEQLLAETAAFDGMSPDQLALIAGCAQNRVFDPGEYLMREGEPADSFYVLRSGRVALETYVPRRGAADDRDARRRRPARLVLAGARPTGCISTPARWAPTHVVAFDGACLRGKSDDDPALGYELMRRFVAGDRRAPAGDPVAAARRLRKCPELTLCQSGPVAPGPVPGHESAPGDRGHLDARARAGEAAGDCRASRPASSRCSTPSARARCRSRSAAARATAPLVHTVRAVGAATAALCAAEPGDAARRARPVRERLAARRRPGRRRRRGRAGGIGLAPLRPAIEHAARAPRALSAGRRSSTAAARPTSCSTRGELERWREAGIDVHVDRRHAPGGTGRGRVGRRHQADPDAPSSSRRRTTAMVCGPEVMMRFAAAGARGPRACRPSASTSRWSAT